MSDIEHHTRAIEAAIWAAQGDGFELSDDDGFILWRAELWEVRDGRTTDNFRNLSLPTVSLDAAQN